ncbi:hypothetical protein [Nocardia mangyaensis]|uniref:hypothetical protein n=1 Tax=Nocardia mangyaensis TaxID=2213200 RepID=UPI002674E751|nr:hypothetical protein [Nocardia mangyaensis]MDO3647800.1 hypothetical protein [Nocardia mangyaensis]
MRRYRVPLESFALRTQASLPNRGQPGCVQELLGQAGEESWALFEHVPQSGALFPVEVDAGYPVLTWPNSAGEGVGYVPGPAAGSR